ncbi:MAG: alkaline phosphatase D family protein [Planctomycetota bacterium]
MTPSSRQDAWRQLPCGNRRRFVAALASVATMSRWSEHADAAGSSSVASDPFRLGVASGDPNHESVVLWTRLALEPLEPAGGMPPDRFQVQWEIADDPEMKSMVQRGTSLATPQLGHSVHAEVHGLESNRWYWYRFRLGDFRSPVGRTRTLPHRHTSPAHLRFAFTSCQNFEQGLFTGYEQMAQDDVDFVIHLGDYIYEYEAGRNGKVRKHLGAEITSLDDYRIRYSQYRLDPLLQSMHARCPWWLTWDDHEFDNNYANMVSEQSHVDPFAFLTRRANAYQAYYEMMPLRRSSIPREGSMRLYRHFRYGDLADFSILDTRQYRSDQPNGDRKSPLNAAARDAGQSLLGSRQRAWLMRNMIQSTSQWNVLPQQVMMGLVDRAGDPAAPQYSMDQWPGYFAERQRLIQFLQSRGVSNPVILTGDIHSNWANELRVNDLNVDEPVVASEFVATSLSSGGNGTERPRGLDKLLANNACVKFHNAERGYVVCDLTPERWVADYRVIDDVLKPGGTTFSRARFILEAGSPKIIAA